MGLARDGRNIPREGDPAAEPGPDTKALELRVTLFELVGAPTKEVSARPLRRKMVLGARPPPERQGLPRARSRADQFESVPQRTHKQDYGDRSRRGSI